MKIEMGESLLYSWLRHVKECKIVQTNWKASTTWTFENRDKIEEIMEKSSKYFEEKYGYKIYKNNSLDQLIKQAEIDVLGINFEEESNKIYAIDVAFHENGLNYGDKEKTVVVIVKKCIRALMCIYGYMGTCDSEIIFASPKINQNVISTLDEAIKETNELLISLGLKTKVRLIANEKFYETVLEPILIASNGVSDTSELFLRSHTLINLFLSENKNNTKNCLTEKLENHNLSDTSLRELKIGKLVQITVRELVEHKKLSMEEIEKMTDKSYSKQMFNSNIPVLKEVPQDGNIDELKRDSKNYNRYYSEPISIYGKKYLLSSQWSENLHREYYENWLSDKL